MEKLYRFLVNVPSYNESTESSESSKSLLESPLIFVSGNWYDASKAQAIVDFANSNPSSKLLLTGGIGRLTTDAVKLQGGEPIALRKRLIDMGVDPIRIMVWNGSSVTTHNVRALIFYLIQLEDMKKSPCDIVVFDEGFLLRRLRATIIGELEKALRTKQLISVGTITFRCGVSCSFEELKQRHPNNTNAASFLCIGEYDRLLKYSWQDETGPEETTKGGPPQLFARSVAMAMAINTTNNTESSKEETEKIGEDDESHILETIRVAVEQIRPTLTVLNQLTLESEGNNLRDQLCPFSTTPNPTNPTNPSIPLIPIPLIPTAKAPPSLPPRRISQVKTTPGTIKSSPTLPPRKKSSSSMLTPLLIPKDQNTNNDNDTLNAPSSSTKLLATPSTFPVKTTQIPTALKSPSHRQSFALVGDVSEAFQFMEDSPMFRAKLDGFETRTKLLWSELSNVIKTTEQYLKTGKKFERSTALLAHDFQLYGGTTSSNDNEGLAPLLHGLGSTLHEVEAGQQTLLATLEHAFINRMREFVKQETTHANELTKQFAKASDAYESALKRSHVVKIDQINSPKASHADQEVTESFERFELLRFGLVRYYNQLERRKNFELIEGVCALLYSYKAYFGSSGHSVVTLVPQMLELQATIQGEREGYKVADNIWDRRQARLAESLVGEGESLAKRFTHGNEEYPLEHFEKTDLGTIGGSGLNSSNGNDAAIDMMGFLLKMSTSVRKDWKRRWFLLQGGNLYYVRDWKDTSPTLVCEVLLCTVRTCTGAKAHRFSFELISPNRRTFTLQASNERDMHAWMLAMQNATEHLLVGGGSSGGNSNTNNSSSSSTTTTDSATTPSNDHPPLARTMSTRKRSAVSAFLASNPICADCDSKNPEWVSINIGALICLKCSGIHRSLGVHISKMRSMTLDRLPDDVLKMLLQLGNEVTNNVYEKDLHLMSGWERPTLNETKTEDLKSFIRAKYEHRGFVDQLSKNDDKSSNSNGTEERKGNDNGSGGSGDGGDSGIVPVLERLMAACRKNDVAEALYCVAHGADVNGVGTNGGTSLHVACEEGSLEVLTFVILNGGKLDRMNREGLSPLDVAMIKGKTEAMEICLARIQKPNRKLPVPRPKRSLKV